MTIWRQATTVRWRVTKRQTCYGNERHVAHILRDEWINCLFYFEAIGGRMSNQRWRPAYFSRE